MRVCTAVLKPAARGGQLFTQEKEWIGAWRTTNSKASFYKQIYRKSFPHMTLTNLLTSPSLSAENKNVSFRCLKSKHLKGTNSCLRCTKNFTRNNSFDIIQNKYLNKYKIRIILQSVFSRGGVKTSSLNNERGDTKAANWGRL